MSYLTSLRLLDALRDHVRDVGRDGTTMEKFGRLRRALLEAAPAANQCTEEEWTELLSRDSSPDRAVQLRTGESIIPVFGDSGSIIITDPDHVVRPIPVEEARDGTRVTRGEN